MSLNLAPLAASATTLIADVVALANPTLLQLIQAKQAGYELGIASMIDLEAKIQWWVDNSATLMPDGHQSNRVTVHICVLSCLS